MSREEELFNALSTDLPDNSPVATPAEKKGRTLNIYNNWVNDPDFNLRLVKDLNIEKVLAELGVVDVPELAFYFTSQDDYYLPMHPSFAYDQFLSPDDVRAVKLALKTKKAQMVAENKQPDDYPAWCLRKQDGVREITHIDKGTFPDKLMQVIYQQLKISELQAAEHQIFKTMDASKEETPKNTGGLSSGGLKL